MLEYGNVYYEDLDSAEQRAALLEFYSSTGGADWTEQLVSTPERDQFQLLVQELEEAGYDLAEQAVNTSLLSTDLVTDLADLPALSANCMLQQWLSFGQLLLKYEWGSNVSYCRWYGVLCCKTSVHPFSVSAIVTYLPTKHLLSFYSTYTAVCTAIGSTRTACALAGRSAQPVLFWASVSGIAYSFRHASSLALFSMVEEASLSTHVYMVSITLHLNCLNCQLGL